MASTLRAMAMLPPLLLLAACESSTRLGSMLPGQSGRQQTLEPPPPLTPAPSSDVDTTTLAPPPGSAPPSSGPPGGAAPPYYPQSAPSAPPASSGGVGSAPGNFPAAPPQVPNSAPPAPSVATAAPTRSSVTGNWQLSESAGTRCRLTLSSAPKLDLYGAGTSGCAAKELQRVNAWELSGSEIILYEAGGAVVARLRGGGTSFAGASTRSGAPISIAK